MLMVQDIVKPRRLEFDKKNKTNTFAQFTTGPFERGYGITIGNALRRMLLSSIEGAAIVGVKLEGIYHEFSSIPGVLEDVTEIILNLKQVRLKVNGNAPIKRMYLKTNKPGKVFIKDIEADSDVELLNPDFHIATLDE